jgi:hypothetical protein
VKNKKRRAGRLALRLKSESKIMKLKNYFTLGLLMSAVSTNAQTAKITVDVAHPGHAISPVLWGIFFEDINLSADGGLYPELVRNRSFEDADTPENWTFVSTGGGHSEAAVVDGDERARPSVPPLNSFNRKSLRINADGAFTLQNDGYWGMNIVAGDRYTLKFAVRDESFTGTLPAKLLSTNSTVLAFPSPRSPQNQSWIGDFLLVWASVLLSESANIFSMKPLNLNSREVITTLTRNPRTLAPSLIVLL